MATVKKKTTTKNAPKNGAGAPAAAGPGPATAADVALAAALPAAPREGSFDISKNIANLLGDPALVPSLRANADAIAAQGAGNVDDALTRLAGFASRYTAGERLAVSLDRVRAALKDDNVYFTAFATAIANVYAGAGKLSAIKGDATLKKFVSNREVQRGAPKKAKTLAKKRRAKKVGPTKSP